MEVKFRLINENDIKGLIDLCNECFHESTSYDYALDVYNKTKNDENQIYLIGEIDGKIVAHTKITVIPTIYEEMNTYAILNHICVKPEYRRNKIGKKMLDVVMQICKKKNCVVAELWSKNFRVEAHGLYNNYGFEVVDAKFFSKEVQ